MSDEKPAEKPEPEAADGEQKEDKDKAADEIPQKETKTEEPNAKNGAEKPVVVQTSANEEKSMAKRNATATKDLPERSGKRLRKSAKAYVPTDFTVEKQRVTIINGRGTRLSAIPSVKKSIESCPASSADLSLAHKLVFSGRGKVAPRDMKHHLLRFNGFLTPIEEDEDEDAREKLDEEAETKMSTRAFKLKIPEIKRLCDFFTVDRTSGGGKMDKEGLIDKLLDFLGEPQEEMTRSAGKKSGGKATKGKKSAKAGKGDSEEDDEDSDPTDRMPSDKELRQWVKAYVGCFNLDKATTKHAIETASDKFGVDLSSKKARIKELLTEEL